MQITVNETGSKTLADSRPMIIDNMNVYVILEAGTASLMVAGRIVAEKLAAKNTSILDAQTWAAQYRDGLAMADEAEANAWFDARTEEFATEVTATEADAQEEMLNMVFALDGSYTSSEKRSHRKLFVSHRTLLNRLRNAFEQGLTAEVKDIEGGPRWFIEISDSEGVARGTYTFNGH